MGVKLRQRGITLDAFEGLMKNLDCVEFSYKGGCVEVPSQDSCLMTP